MIVTQVLKKANMLAAMLVMASFAGVAADCEDHSKRTPQPGDLFVNEVVNALDPGFIYDVPSNGKITIGVTEGMWDAGLSGDAKGKTTRIYGYYDVNSSDKLKGNPTWPGKTFEVRKAKPIQVTWENNIPPGPYIITGADNTGVPQWNVTEIGPDPYYNTSTGYGDYSALPVVDESLHWAYSLDDLKTNLFSKVSKATLGANGVPIVTHLHGGHSDDIYDGNPEFFFNHNLSVLGPEFETNVYEYKNNFEPTAIWYHDHALGITRLNVYAGLAGFYILRDPFDAGNDPKKKPQLPVYPYEVALAIQDRMFKNCGEFLYPAFPGDEAHYGFIAGEGVDLPGDKFPEGGPTALAEFFGDHMVVNGKVWPKMDVEPRNYRLRLLNGCDSRFLVIEFVMAVNASATTFHEDAEPLPFHVIGSDQGFRKQDKVGLNITATKLVMGPGERFDVIIDFQGLNGTRVIMKNTGGDEPFGGFPAGEQIFDYTDRIMAFDVGTEETQDDFEINDFLSTLEQKGHPPIQGMVNAVKRIRKVALFEGKDEYGRLQPVLGTVEPSTNYKGETIEWPDDSANCACLGLCVEKGCTDPSGCDGQDCSGCPYTCANLTGPVQGTVGWHTDPSSENPKQNDVEKWELWNLSGDAHPVHLHLVDFEVISRQNITDPESLLTVQPLVQHNGLLGEGFFAQACNATECLSDPLVLEFYYDIGYPKDVVIALPGQVTTIKAKFHKKGRYVWHCHILSHEDHEMMRVMYVGDETATQRHLRGESQNVEDNEGGDSNEGEESS